MSLFITLSEPLRHLLENVPHLMVHSIEFAEDGTPEIHLLDRATGAVEHISTWLPHDRTVEIDGEDPRFIASRSVSLLAQVSPERYAKMLERHARQDMHVPTLAELDAPNETPAPG